MADKGKNEKRVDHVEAVSYRADGTPDQTEGFVVKSEAKDQGGDD